jgi:hypothetical protein
MELAEYQRCFPPGTAVPEYLRALLEFQNLSRDWYSDHFELDIWEFGKPNWFDGDRNAAEQFAVFGHGSDGSLYACWLYSGRVVMDAPVVFLGSEGTDCGLVSDHLEEFLGLLAVGADELGFAVSWGDVAESTSPAPRLAAFREWLQVSFGISRLDEPLAQVMAARARHPDFGAWLAKWQAIHFGS